MKRINSNVLWFIILLFLYALPTNAQDNIKEALELLRTAQSESESRLKIRFLNESLNNASLVEAFYERGRTYLIAIGDVERAVKDFSDAKSRWSEGESITSITKEQIDREIEYINQKFKTLKIKLINSNIDRLGYIKNVRFKFTYPPDLDENQKQRVKYLESSVRTDKYLFSNIDPDDGKVYFEIKYFPARTSEAFVKTKYALTVSGNNPADDRRYRFDLIEIEEEGKGTDDIEIEWMQNDWELVERVPPALHKIEFPEKYSFISNLSNLFSTLQESEYKNLYLPLGTDMELNLASGSDRSEEYRSERLFKLLNSTVISIVIFGTFMFSR